MAIPSISSTIVGLGSRCPWRMRHDAASGRDRPSEDLRRGSLSAALICPLLHDKPYFQSSTIRRTSPAGLNYPPGSGDGVGMSAGCHPGGTPLSRTGWHPPPPSISTTLCPPPPPSVIAALHVTSVRAGERTDAVHWVRTGQRVRALSKAAGGRGGELWGSGPAGSRATYLLPEMLSPRLSTRRRPAYTFAVLLGPPRQIFPFCPSPAFVPFLQRSLSRSHCVYLQPFFWIYSLMT